VAGEYPGDECHGKERYGADLLYGPADALVDHAGGVG
jgi:hypothetical protein